MASADRLIEIFTEAKARPAGTEREHFLAEVCQDDPQLKEQVLSLLQAHDGAGDFLKNTLVLSPNTLLTEKPGDRIGRYKLLQQIGEGGCGVVYMAEQEEPVRRRVALKVIKLGMDTKNVIARFEAERQALALMDHPNIAKVLDAGATETGRPYFVMELVRGIKITEYCDQNNLSTKERLKLFTQVCHAIQHAHQKGIIHRDIKPSNILVTQNESVAVPKVIDFGIAKATTDQRLTDKTVFTGFEQFIGTPAYMSPEQAMMTSLDIDTRTDVYALGVLLYELLTGQTPFDAKDLMAAGLDAMRRTICEQEPPKPSTRLTQELVAADVRRLASNPEIRPAATARQRGENSKIEIDKASSRRLLQLKELIPLLRGDLDWIVMKALEKDRTRRYETANGLAMDIQRHLSDEPVTARPPGNSYRLQKLARRHKLAFAALAAVTMALVLGVVASSWQAVRATRAKAVAVSERKRADAQAAMAISITKYLQQMLDSINPAAGKGLDYTVRQLLDDYASDLEKKLPDQPEIEATLQSTIGNAYHHLDQLGKARQHLKRAVVLRRGVFGENHEKYADSLVDYAWTVDLQRREFPEHEADLRRAVAVYRARGIGGEPVIHALRTLQWILIEQAFAGVPGKWNEIEPVAIEALAEARKSPGVEFPEIAYIQGGLVSAKVIQRQNVEAEKIARESLAMRMRLNGPEHLETAWGYYVLSQALRPQHKFTEATRADQQALAIMQKKLPPEHRSIALALTAVMDTLELADRTHELAIALPAPGNLGDLESVFLDVLTTAKPAKLNEEDPVLVAARGLARFIEMYMNLGQELALAGKTSEAKESRRKAMRLLETLQTRLAGNVDLLAYAYASGTVALMQAAEPQAARELGRKLLAHVAPNICFFHNQVAWFLATAENPAHRDPALAIELAQKAVESKPGSSSFRNTLSVARYRAGDWQQAISDLDKSVSLNKGGDSFDWFLLAMAHWQLGDKVQARKWFDQAVAWMDKNQPNNEELRRFRTEAEKLIHE